MAISTQHPRKSHRIAASWAGVAAALLTTGALATTVVASAGSPAHPRQDPSPTTPAPAIDAYVACMRTAGGSPDTLEHWVDACESAAQAAQDRYLSCMHDAGVSPDALDRWTAACRDQAAAAQGS